jgi:hypothetical protein
MRRGARDRLKRMRGPYGEAERGPRRAAMDESGEKKRERGEKSFPLTRGLHV